ncbi:MULTISPECIES: ABC transporter permease [unclassified Crossiella]|uniref:ABC transporter permease n=1 Tax=unclassified Crossiella TaxID=2620835 RepID=UPI001FFE2F4B|nr:MULTISPECIES: ABC transporter permease [unclassified Crossiella]MCK2244864.1 ABC transporter permease [Crossiella sp. S99.2]MCK2258583.1 ABC transporter permease [Crossiella sp. S99.1]
MTNDTAKTPADSGQFINEGTRPLAKRLASANTLWIGLVLLVLLVVFSALRPDSFLTLFNFQQLFIEASVLLVLAVGMTYVIITAGIDLSVGSVLVFAGVVGAQVMEAMSPGGDATNAGVEVILVGFLITIVGGAAWGLLNGLLIAKAKIPALIVTLGSFGAALGAAQLLTDGVDVRTVPTLLRDWLGFGATGIVPNLVIVAVLVTAVGAWLLATTRFGRYTLAIGSNPEAARRSGIKVDRHLVLIYTYVGALAGLAGFMSLAYYGTTTISGHTTENLNAIAAVVLGGTSLFGGVGSVIGTVIGVFIPTVLKKGFLIIDVPQFWQPVAIGAVLVAAVWFDQLRRRARNSR